MRIENNDFDIRWFDTLESTNEYCKLLAPKTVEEFTVICARSQTSGIGQQGNVWVSEPYKNLTFSIILKPTFLAAEDQYNLTMAIAVAVAETLEQLFSVLHSPTSDSTSPFSHLRSPFSVQIKWPNDIYVGDRKICGILATNHLSGNRIEHSVCGIGLNVNQTHFPDWVPNPTSMQLHTGQEFSIDKVLHTLLYSITNCYKQLSQPAGPRAIKGAYLDRLYRKGIPSVFIHNGCPIRATITGIDRYGHLMLQTDDGADIACAMKEIQFVI